MKKILLFLFALVALLPAQAKLDGNGYYRVQNYVTGRWCYVTDDKGDVNMMATTADVGAIQLWSDFLRAASNPSSIIYISKHEGNTYELEAQGAKVSKFMGSYPSIIPGSSKYPDTYLCYGTKKGVAKYLGDAWLDPTDPQGEASVDVEGDRRYWYIHPVGTSDDNYFGVVPSVTAGGKYYYPLYADFSMSAFSAGMKFYTISKVADGMAVLKEIKGTVPAGTPVIVECPTMLATTNRISVGGTGASVGVNCLGGVYFDNDIKTHYNRTAYDKKTMRVLGTDANGNLAFVTSSSLSYLPANQSYLKVSSSDAATLRVVTEAEYEQLRYEATSISLDQTSVTRNAGESFSLKATVLPVDNKATLTWSSSDATVASVADGNVTCLKAGQAVITVKTNNGLSASCTVKVLPLAASVTIAPESLTLTEGDEAQLTATVLPAEVANKSVTWSINNTTIATITAEGKVKALAPGQCTVTAETANGKKAYCLVTVEKRIIAATEVQLSATTLKIMEGGQATLKATVLPAETTDKTVVWSSSNSDIVTVEGGVVTGVSVGYATVTATCGNVSATCEVTVTHRVAPVQTITLSQTEANMAVGETLQLTAVTDPADHTDGPLLWTSSSVSVVYVDRTGLLTARGEGTATVTVKCGNASAQCEVTVKKGYVPVESILLNRTELSLNEGETATLYAVPSPAGASSATIIWSSDNEAVATVADGVVSAISAGTANIVASADGVSATCVVKVIAKEDPVVMPTSIRLDKTEATIAKGETLQLTAVVLPTNATDKTVSWMSADTSVATVDSNGLVTAIGGGKTVVTATTVNGHAAYSTITVEVALEGLKLVPDEYTAEEGAEFDFEVDLIPADATAPKSLTWSSSNEAVATISQEGHCVIVGEGTAEIKVTDGQFEAYCHVVGLSGIAELLGTGSSADVYSLDGVVIRKGANAEQLKNLPKGIYVINGRKVVK